MKQKQMSDFYQGLFQEILDGERFLTGCGIEPSDDLSIIKKKIKWGTYGKHGDEPLRFVRLIDCSTEHLQAILREQRGGIYYRRIIEAIIKDRAL